MGPLVLFLHIVSIATICLLLVEGATRPNIVVVMADDLGWNDVGFHGSDQIPTPNIDALAYNGVILNRHYTMPTCTPSRAAFLTGKYPIRTGMQGHPIRCGEPRGLPLEETILPQRLKDLGYTTRLVGKWHVGSMRSEYTPTKRGFDSHFGYWNGYISYFDHMVDRTTMIGYDFHRDLNVTWEGNGQYATDVFTREAVRLISTHDTSRPLFLEVAHLAVHSGRDVKKLEVPNTEDALKKYDYIPDTQRRIFAEMTARLDDSVGQIVTALLEKGILSNTIVVFLSDNGAQTLGVHQNWGSNWPYRGLKFTLYEGGVKGVAAVWSPWLRNPGRVTQQLIHISDWYPTIYSMAGGEVPNLGIIDGIDQWPSISENNNYVPRIGALLNVGDIDDNEAIIDGKWKLLRSTYLNGIYDSYYGDDGRGLPNPPYNITGIITSPVSKAIQSLQLNTSTKEHQLHDRIKQMRTEVTVNCQDIVRNHTEGPYCPSYCLFDLENDPCESVNLISKHPDITEMLKKKLQRFRTELIPDLSKPVDPNSNPTYYNNTWVSWLDEECVERLRNHEVGTKNSASTTSFSFYVVFLFFVFNSSLL